MNAQQLKNSILQEAIEGRLVLQDPNDEPASVLLDKIRKEKARLVKEGKLKKKDLEETPISEDEIPFKIPESWEWVRHNDLFDISGGSQPPKSDFSLEEKEGYIRLYQIRDYGEKPSPVYIPISKASKITQKGDILLARYGGSLGKVFIAEDGAYNVAMAKVEYLFNKSLIDHDYLYYYYNCSLYQDLVKGNNRSAQGGFNKEDLGSLLFPLPPLAEQHRIVAKIEELLPKVEEYGKAQEALDKLNEELPERLKKSILQEAIEGRLVPQDPNDEPASVLLDKIRKEKAKLVKEGKLKKKDLEETPISEDVIPFKIPDNWEWCRLEDISIYISRGKSPTYSEVRKYPIVAQKCNQWSGFSLERAKFADPKTVDKYTEERLLKDGDLLWNSTGLGTLGRMAIYDSTVNQYGWAVADSHVTVIRTLPSFCYYKYLFYYFSSAQVQNVIEDKSDGSTKQKELYQETVKKYEVPLPPLAEQKRIVAKIEQLMKEINKLKV
jgi:type I restriction enzyme S subunit